MRWRDAVILVCLTVVGLDAAAREPAAPPPEVLNPDARLCIQPLNPTAEAMLPAVARGITYLYGVPVELLPARDLPASTWYAPRKRHRADALLSWLRREILPNAPQCRWIVGLTRGDISVTKGEHKDWGVLGLGEIGGAVAVVSSFRTHKKLRPPHTALRRTVKVVNHEIGHMMGLPHVQGPGCLMNDAEGTVLTTDAETGLLCASTIAHIEAHKGLRIPRHREMEWPRVE